MKRASEIFKAKGERSGAWAIQPDELPPSVIGDREPLLAGLEENAVYRAIAYVEHANQGIWRLKGNEYLALSVTFLAALAPVFLGYWYAAPIGACLTWAIYVQARSRQRREAVARFLEREQGVLKDLVQSGCGAGTWGLALWGRLVAVQSPRLVLVVNGVILGGFLLGTLLGAPIWGMTPEVSLVLAPIAFIYAAFIGWYDGRARYRPWVELPGVIFQVRAYQFARRYLKRLPPQLEQVRLVLISYAVMFFLGGLAYGGFRLYTWAEFHWGREWLFTTSYWVLTFPPLVTAPGLLAGAIAGNLRGRRCRNRMEGELERLEEEVEGLLEVIQMRVEGELEGGFRFKRRRGRVDASAMRRGS